MKLKEILAGIDVVETTADPELDVADISYDSRKTQPGSLFAAIVGFESDGHKFIPAAAEKGAAAVICQSRPQADIAYVLVKNSRKALALAARNYFGSPAARMKMIGVTGTNGKTTTAFLIKHMLEQTLGAKVGLIGTNQNMIGPDILPTERTTPESYELQKLLREMADAGCEYVVMEVSSHALELDRVAGIRYTAGVFTNLTQDHLDFHSTMEEYAEAKAKLFAVCDKGAVNADDAWSQTMLDAARCPMLRYSQTDGTADIIAREVKLASTGVSFTVFAEMRQARVDLGIPGMFSVYNAMSAIACAMMLGIPLEAAARSLSTAKGVAGRMEVVETGGDYTVLIDFAHTPDALENVLLSMRRVSGGRLVVVFGCGGDRDRKKRPVMGEIAGRCADFVIVTSDNPRTEKPGDIISEIVPGVERAGGAYVVIEDRREAIAYAIGNHRPGDVIVLAGKGHETYQEINHIKYHMDEREIVAQYLAPEKRTLQ